jgi:NMD protein affecting ribosome stability and mRNA decay
MSHGDLELQLSMLCVRCGGKIVLMSEKLECQMTGGLCRDCVGKVRLFR